MARSIAHNKLIRYIAAFVIACDFIYVIYLQLSCVNNKTLSPLTNVQVEKPENDELTNIQVETPKNDEYQYPDISQSENEDIINYSKYITTFRKRPEDNRIIDYEKIVAHCDMSKLLAEQCLEYLDKFESEYTIPDQSSNSTECSSDQPPMLFHVFWKGDVSDKLAMMIKSFMFTQPLQCSKLYVWLDKTTISLDENPHSKPLLSFSPKFIEFKKWDTEEQLNHDPIYKGWQSIFTPKRKSVSFSDLVRFVVLQRYGGIYVDADVLLLRDLRPFYQTGFEFSYQWSFKEDYNTAVLRLRANSTATRMAIEGAMQNRMQFHPFSIKKYFTNVKNPTKKDVNPYIYMLPVPLFDPLWLKKDRKQPKSTLTPNINIWFDVFRSNLSPNEFGNVDPNKSPAELRKVDGFFPGAFTYHWHNNWATEIRSTSWMGILQSAYDEFLSGQQPNIYNEYF